MGEFIPNAFFLIVNHWAEALAMSAIMAASSFGISTNHLSNRHEPSRGMGSIISILLARGLEMELSMTIL